MAVRLHNRETLKVGSVVKLVPFEDLNDFYTYTMSEEGYRRAVLSKNSSLLFRNERVVDKKLVVYPPVDMVEWLVCSGYGNGCSVVHGGAGHTALVFDSTKGLYECPLVVTEVLDRIGDANRYRIATFSMNYDVSEMDFCRGLQRSAYRPLWKPEAVFPFAVTDEFLIYAGYRLDY